MIRALSVAFCLLMGASTALADNITDIFTSSPTNGVLPMETILSAARAEIDGTIMEIELERKRGAWRYEVDVSAADGRKWELLYDAHTGQLLSRKRD